VRVADHQDDPVLVVAAGKFPLASQTMPLRALAD
jgi:hypothetical protein